MGDSAAGTFKSGYRMEDTWNRKAGKTPKYHIKYQGATGC